MVFKTSATWDNPAMSQSGFPTPGAGAQTTGDATIAGAPAAPMAWEPQRSTQGIRSWLFGSREPGQSQSGFPAPGGPGQGRPAGSMPNDPPIFGGVYQHETPYYDRGAAAYVPNFGKVLTNPIGAGVVAQHRPQASYGRAAQYENGALWWTSQVIPTSINLQGLTSPDVLAAILSQEEIYAVVRTTG